MELSTPAGLINALLFRLSSVGRDQALVGSKTTISGGASKQIFKVSAKAIAGQRSLIDE